MVLKSQIFSGSVAAAPTSSKKSHDDLRGRESKPVMPDASAPTAPHGPPIGSGIRPVLISSSVLNQLHCSVF
ncbi:hypothetical protein HanRHA438_Chr08g0346341 [Helianthus annuus]|nr:hypothetical protein HanHA89_Chr08g0294021 [Helianthus annuus]KAJ0722132.1 hypothetical protein HanOQP8_Chr08g0283281 [Helianthus annuus]KAJ0897492.1 hypothetical protein HanRHA438_Chr08g0346341 [Helianthus annuus]